MPTRAGYSDDREVVRRVIIRFLALLALSLAFLVPAGAATAAPAQTDRFQHLAGDFNTCNGEFVAAEVTIHTVANEQNDGRFLFHFILHGQAVGEQGNEYVMNWNGKGTFSDDSFSDDARLRLISKGAEPNQWVKVHFDSDGNFTIEGDCRG